MNNKDNNKMNNKIKCTVNGIQWDTDNEPVFLPKTMTVEINAHDNLPFYEQNGMIVDQYVDDILDALSEKTGWCVLDYADIALEQ